MNKLDKYASVAVFCYDRLDKLKQLVNSLKNNEESSNTKIYFFVDFCDENVSITKDIIKYLEDINNFFEKEIILRDKKYGLKKNIEDGIDYVFKFEERIICLEDDLIVDKYFLSYMNLCLNKYRAAKDVWHINGWSHPQARFLMSEIYVGKIVNVWGWATWKDRWEKHINRGHDKISKLNQDSIRNFNFYNLNKNFQQQLIDNEQNKINTWAIYWYQTVFLNFGKTIFPKHSLVRNVGFDGSGTNTGNTKYYNPKLKNKKLNKFLNSLKIDKLNNFFTIVFFAKLYSLKKFHYHKNKLFN